MVFIFDTESGARATEMEPQSYADEVMMAGWTEVPRMAVDAGGTVSARLAEHEADRRKPSPFADPDFIARIYRAQG